MNKLNEEIEEELDGLLEMAQDNIDVETKIKIRSQVKQIPNYEAQDQSDTESEFVSK